MEMPDVPESPDRWHSLAAQRAELDRQLSDPDCPPEKAAELTDDLITIDMALGPLRRAMGQRQK
jgi:hypothetical protein